MDSYRMPMMLPSREGAEKVELPMGVIWMEVPEGYPLAVALEYGMRALYRVAYGKEMVSLGEEGK